MSLGPLATSFATLTDPRVDRTKEHLLLDIVLIAICAVVCGADGWVEVVEFGKTKRRSHDKRRGKAALHLVSAWASANRLVLGQVATDAKSNEITAIPELLRLLDLKGCIVTIDAAGTQTAIAEQIVAAEGDYVLALKGNQKGLAEDVTRLFEWAHSIDFAEIEHDHVHSTTKGHGRVEIRDCWTIADPRYLGDLRQGRKWKSLRSVAQVQLERRDGERISVETRYYISSLPGNATQIQNAVRLHWESVAEYGIRLLVHPF